MSKKFTKEEKEKIEEEERLRFETRSKLEESKSDNEFSFLTTLLLCLFLGPLGAHRFYVGKTITGTTIMVLSLTFFGLLVSIPWTLLDLILIISQRFSDHKGRFVKR